MNYMKIIFTLLFCLLLYLGKSCSSGGSGDNVGEAEID